MLLGRLEIRRVWTERNVHGFRTRKHWSLRWLGPLNTYTIDIKATAAERANL